MQINQQLVRFNQVLITKQINKKVLKIFSVNKPLFTEHKLLFSKRKPSEYHTKIKQEINWAEIETETEADL